jgi:TrmH family RNA methyltransferase
VAHLTSTDNTLIKALARLDQARERRDQGLFLVEGRRAIATMLDHGRTPVHLFRRDDVAHPDGWPEATTVSARVAERLSQASSPSGLVAAFPLPDTGTLGAEALAAGGLVLVSVGDPGNLGTLIRTAAAMGVRRIVCVDGADPFAPKAVQSTAGTLALVAITCLSEAAALTTLLAEGAAPCCALVVRGGVAPKDLPAGPRWLLVGSEAHGLAEAWMAGARQRLTLPMPGGAESLNAAIAGSIALYLLMERPA